ncbi:MAG: hypothetical protein HY735_01735 [Verrucomicrobia bacterium]|nr:hypothetical protein [Verrucomicrobiota bacterium]
MKTSFGIEPRRLTLACPASRHPAGLWQMLLLAVLAFLPHLSAWAQ